MTQIFAGIRIAIRGGGDLGSGAAYRLHRCGFPVLIIELSQPLLVRRAVCFGSAILAGHITIEGVTARLAHSVKEVHVILDTGEIPVIADTSNSILAAFSPAVLIDARMLKADPGEPPVDAALRIGLGPGFDAPINCDAVVETNRGHNLGRVIWQGSAEPDTNIPGQVLGKEAARVLRAPADGIIHTIAEVGVVVQEGQPIAEINGDTIIAPFTGVVRGLIHDGTTVPAGLKIGDIDPRAQPDYAFTISDKSLAVGGGVLEAVLSSPVVQSRLKL
jgi:xanthine dehydrogenase accessory factor